MLLEQDKFCWGLFSLGRGMCSYEQAVNKQGWKYTSLTEEISRIIHKLQKHASDCDWLDQDELQPFADYVGGFLEGECGKMDFLVH